MKTTEHVTCNDPETGRLIFEYETGGLSEADRDRFDEHLMNCEFCCHELDVMRPVASLFREQRRELAEYLRAHALSGEAAVSRSAVGKQPLGEALADWTRNFIEWMIRPRVFAPALAGIAALFMLVTFTARDRASGQYLNYLSFEGLPYHAIEGRSVESPESAEFAKAMQDYLHGNYGGAITKLKGIVKAAPQQESAWVYLGVCYYMNRQPKRAIKALDRALKLLDRTLEPQSTWFLAQSYLLKGNKKTALPLLDSLVSWNREYADQAAAMRTRLGGAVR